MAWLKNVNDDLYDPSYSDMLRVAFTSEFGRGKLQDLVALLSGRNFETKQYEDVIARESFEKLKKGILNYMNQTLYERLVMIIRSAGFISPNIMGGKNAIDFAYILYLKARSETIPAADIEHIVRRWFVLSQLTGRYSGTPESAFDSDIRQIESHGVLEFTENVIKAELSDDFWTALLPQQLETSSPISPSFLVFLASHVKLEDKGFLSRDITVHSLILNRSDVHHLYPRNYLKQKGLQKVQYNQVANFAIAQSEINISISDTPPKKYFQELLDQCNGGKQKYGGITVHEELIKNLYMHCIPEGVFNSLVDNYEEFLYERRKLMAVKIKNYYDTL